MKPKSAAAGPVVPPTVLHFGGQAWNIVSDYNVLCELEEMTGVNVLFGQEASLAKPTATLVRAWLFLALRQQGAKLTLQEVGAQLTMDKVPEVLQRLTESWFGPMPQPKEVEAGQAGPVPAAAEPG
jgi:hypothetical protein